MNQADEQAIIWEMEAFAEAWSSGDAWSAASFCTDDCMRVGPFGDVQHGRAEVEAAYDKLFHEGMRGAKVILTHSSVAELSPLSATWQGDIEIVSADGTAAWKGRLVQVMQKVKGRWLISETHPVYSLVETSTPALQAAA